MARTGHRSVNGVNGVRLYKRISEEQQQALLDVINLVTNGSKEACPPDTKMPRIGVMDYKCSLEKSFAMETSANQKGSVTPQSTLPSLTLSACTNVTTINCNFTPVSQ